MTSANLGCIVPALILIAIALVVATVARRLVFAADEIAILGLMLAGLRQIVGPRRTTLGCGLIVGLSVGIVVFFILSVASFATCFADKPSEFCSLFPFIGK